MAAPDWRDEAAMRLQEVIDHGDDMGTLANSTGDELRDALKVAADRLRMHVASHYDVLVHFAKTDPDLVKKVLAGAEDIDRRPQTSVATEDLRWLVGQVFNGFRVDADAPTFKRLMEAI